MLVVGVTAFEVTEPTLLSQEYETPPLTEIVAVEPIHIALDVDEAVMLGIEFTVTVTEALGLTQTVDVDCVTYNVLVAVGVAV